MSTLRKASPARSQGTLRTPKRKNRRTLSVTSAKSNDSVRLTALIQQPSPMDSFTVSPLVGSILMDGTDIEVPKCKNWWRKLSDNSRDVFHVLEQNQIVEPNNIIEELDFEILSQEKKNYTMDLPESSGSESINSIVLPQRKLFTEKVKPLQKAFGKIVGPRETLAKLDKPNTTGIDKTVIAGTRDLFQNRQRTKPIFPSAGHLNISRNKIAADKTKELATMEPTQVRNIFGSRATKRKNIFANFIASDSEEEMPEIQGKIFEFPKNLEQKSKSKTVGQNESKISKNKSPNSSQHITEDQNVNKHNAAKNKAKSLTSAVKDTEGSEKKITADQENDEELNFTLRYDDENNEIEDADKTITNESNIAKKSSKIVSQKDNSNISKRSLPTKSNKVINVSADVVTQENDTVIDRQRSKLIFPAALLTADKTNELAAIEPTAQVRNIFGNRAATKRKNIFTNFIASESEDEISETQGKVLGFQKKAEVRRRGSSSSRGIREPSPMSSVTTEIEMDDWKMLPSSTMVENQLEIMIAEGQTPKRAKLSKLSEDKESETAASNTTKHSNKSNTSKDTSKPRKSKTFTKEKSLELEKTRKSKTFTKEKSPVADSRKSKTFTKDKADIEFSQNKSKLTENDDDEEIFDRTPVVQDKSKSKTDQNVSQLSITTRSQGKNKKQETPEHKLNNSKKASRSISLKENGSTNSSISNRSLPTKSNKSTNDDSYTPKNKSLEISKVNDNEMETVEECHEDIGMDEPDDVVMKSSSVENMNDIADKNIVPSKAQNECVEKIQDAQVVEQNDNVEIAEQMDFENEEEPDEIQVENENVDSQIEDNIQNKSQDFKNKDEQNKSQEMEDKCEQNESQEIENEDEQNESQVENVIEQNESQHNEDEDEQNEKQEIEDEENESQVENVNEQNESQPIGDEDEQNESQEVENEDEQNESQEMEDEDKQNESQQIEDEDDQNESQEVENEDEQNESQEVVNEDENNASQEIEDEDEQNESQEVASEQTNVSQESEEEIEEDEELNMSQEEIDQQSDTEENSEEIEQEADSEAVDSDNDNEPIHAEDNNSDNEDLSEPNEEIDNTPNISHDTTGRHRKKIHSPEAILHDIQNNVDSFTVHGRNTSARKTDFMKTLNIKQSLAIRESIGSDGSKNSTAEGSGWDSHRTTRKTLRQTFGKDFTPRKSLRTLVMEKSARRQTAHDAASVTHKFPQANSTELPGVSNFFDDEMDENKASNHDVSLRTRQATLEKHLDKVAANQAKMRLEIKEAVLKSLNAPPIEYVFKVPAKPMFPRRNTQAKKPAKTPLLGDLPPEVVEDLKYKPPKRFKPSNASWITKRLYKYLETKLEPKYDYKARVRAERLVEQLYAFAKDTRRRAVAAPDAVATLKREMARLGIVATHFEFDAFFEDFMPREIRSRVVPDIVNNISVPKNYIHASIL